MQMIWKDLEDSIVELERDMLCLVQDIESRDIISKEVVTLQEENAKLVIQLKQLDRDRQLLGEELEKERKSHDTLKKTCEVLQENISKKETACIVFQNDMEICDRDSLRLKKAKEQFHVGKEFTGIRWDYSAPPNLCKGYIVNKSKKTIDTFELDKNKYTEEKIREFLWSLVEKHSSVGWNDLVTKCNGEELIENKENKKIND